MLSKISGGTPFGDMTAYGGLSAAYNGVHLKPAASCSGKNAATSGTNGLSFSTPQAISCVEIRGSNDYGYGGLDATPMTFNLRASNATLTNVLLGSVTFKNYITLGERIRRIFSNDITTQWTSIWVEVTVGASGTLVLGEIILFAPYATETVSAGPNGAVSSLKGLRAQSHGSGTATMYASCAEATLVATDGTTQVLRSPLNYQPVSFAGFTAKQTVWAWLLWGSGVGFKIVPDLAAAPSRPNLPTGYTHARELFPVVMDGSGGLHCEDHPVRVAESTFYYTSGDFVAPEDTVTPPAGDQPLDLSGYVPAGASHASIFLDPEMTATSTGAASAGLILRNGEGGNYIINMLYAAKSEHTESQLTAEIPMSDDRMWTYQWLDPANVATVSFGFQLLAYRF